MPGHPTRALCVLAVGQKHQRLLTYKLPELRRYACTCGAELVVLAKPLDLHQRRSILGQKLLIPATLKKYDLVASLDLDVHISRDAPDIFEPISSRTGLAAVCDPRGTEVYKRTWSNSTTVVEETTASYFSSRDFEPSSSLVGSINGGVLVFRTELVAELFREYYYSDHTQGGVGDGNEEAPLAYLTQTRGLFQPLSSSFNWQLLYDLQGTDEGRSLLAKIETISKRWRFGAIRRWTGLNPDELLLARYFSRFIKDRLRDKYIVHMAGGLFTRFRVDF